MIISLAWLYGVIIIILLFIQMWILHYWAKEHATLMSIMTHRLTEINKKLK